MPLRLPSPDPRQTATSPVTGLLSPAWPRPSRPRATSQPYARHGSMAFRDNLINQAEKIHRKVTKIVQKMTLVQKILAIIALVIAAVLGILFLVFNEKIFELLVPIAKKWKETTGGWVILWIMTFITAFPPMIGYSTCATLAGFVYGIWEGWAILAVATVAGSTCSLIVSRTLLRNYVERLVANDKRFAALSLTLKHDGLKLLCMIRLCPLPYSISNGAMSTFPTVHPATYALATAIVTPKLFIPVFIGSRLAIIAKTGEKMSAGARVVNWLSIIIGAAVGIGTGLFIYRQTMARAAELEAEEAQNVRDPVRRTGGPPVIFADDPEAQATAENLAHDNDDVDYFDDVPSPKPPYSDSLDGEEDVFGQGDGSYEDTIGLHGQKK